MELTIRNKEIEGNLIKSFDNMTRQKNESDVKLTRLSQFADFNFCFIFDFVFQKHVMQFAFGQILFLLQ